MQKKRLVFCSSTNIFKPFIKNSLGSCKPPRQFEFFSFVLIKSEKGNISACHIHIITPSSLKLQISLSLQLILKSLPRQSTRELTSKPPHRWSRTSYTNQNLQTLRFSLFSLFFISFEKSSPKQKRDEKGKNERLN